MNTVSLYKNPQAYPNFSESLTFVLSKEATPRNMDSNGGYVDMAMSFDQAMSGNYLKIERESQVIWAYISKVEERSGDKLFRFFYMVDAWRTYRAKLNLDNQVVVRAPAETDIYDSLLGSTEAFNQITSTPMAFFNSGRRIMVVQVKRMSGDGYSCTPVIPTPYHLYICPYDVNDWTDAVPIRNLVALLTTSGRPSNIVTMYSIPFFDMTGMSTADTLPVKIGDNTTTIAGWTMLSWGLPHDAHERITHDALIELPGNLTRTKHSVMIVIPDAGIINVPDELLYKDYLYLRQDVDVFSGASNYMLVTKHQLDGESQYHVSVRGASINSIPIVSDPMDTYISQNQNALTTQLLGDVASMGAGALMIGAAVASGGTLAMVAGGAGANQILGAISSRAAVNSQIKDAGHQSTNPPAFLGTALAAEFSQKFWVVIVRPYVTNADLVHAEMGYPCGIMQPLVFPAAGFIQTQGCNVKSDGTVPLWAIQEVNRMFDNGVKVEA